MPTYLKQVSPTTTTTTLYFEIPLNDDMPKLLKYIYTNTKPLQSYFKESVFPLFFSDLSLPNMRYLSADQALADTAFFIVGMNSQYKLPENTKWIVIGKSYSANLAAWLRDKFSHLVYASVSYSGPVLAKLNFYGK